MDLEFLETLYLALSRIFDGVVQFFINIFKEEE